MCHYESADEWEALAEKLREDDPGETAPEREEAGEPDRAPADD